LLLRDFVEADAEKVVGWLDNEREFYYWSADRYGHYPITAHEIIANYNLCKTKTFFKPMTMEEDGRPVGHFILRTPTANPKVIRIGFIIVDKALRGKGYGKALVRAAVGYAKNVIGADEINLGVFMNNKIAIECYKSLGFAFSPEDGDEIHSFDYKNEKWVYGKMTLRDMS